MTTPQDQLTTLSQALQQLRGDALAVPAFSHLTQSQPELLAALPAPFAEVLQTLLDRLESSALFSEESCSFSQIALLDNLQLWLDKAQLQLDKPKPT
ncbi:hypothetical protein [Polaromonas sp. SM01]|uniref:hypothetical protein n=1 Tax=Polaromonas sp. SM01 TaxID=3085630 RepID=UPI0029810C65|nr:hypothetical protein [Polaromonas sp. SM01]MDW5443494.1 hypothetical protein [Polaromonas sp. SM01]